MFYYCIQFGIQRRRQVSNRRITNHLKLVTGYRLITIAPIIGNKEV